MGNTIVNTGTTIAVDFGITTAGTETVINSGTIEATGTASIGPQEFTPTGIAIGGGGSVTNSSTGTIFGGGLGIFLGATGGVTNSVDNSGVISTGDHIFINDGTTFTSVAVNVVGGVVTNGVTGTIIGDGAGVNFIANTLGAGGTLNNSGRIEATGTFVNNDGLIDLAVGVVTQAGGSLTNQSTGTITGFDGVILNGSVTTFLDNVGEIEGTGNSGVALIADGSLENSGHITGANYGLLLTGNDSITNLAGGTIGGGRIGIAAVGTGASIDNAGIVIATGTAFVSNGILVPAEAIYLDGGTVSNQGTIAGYGAGIQSFSHLGNAAELARNSAIATTVFNSGVIEATTGTITYTNGTVTGSSGGVVLDGGGALTNAATGIISAHFGVYLNGGGVSIANTVDNLGTIDGVSSFGVFLGENASLTNSGHIAGDSYGTFLYAANRLSNLARGTISGGNVGVLANNTAGVGSTITNAGTIIATGTTFTTNGTLADAGGAALLAGGTLDNEVTGTIIGYVGAAAAVATTFINAGTIIGTHGTAVYFAGQGDVLVDDPGSVFSGTVLDAAGDGFLQLAGGNSTGTLSGFGSEFTGFSTLAVEAGAWEIANSTIAGTVAFSNDGIIVATGTGGLTIDAAITGTGTILIDPTTLVLNGSVSAGQVINFAGSDDLLDLGDAKNFAGTLANFSPGDSIVLTNVASITSESFSHGVLHLGAAGGSIALTFASPATFESGFSVESAHGQTTIAAQVLTPVIHAPASLTLVPGETTGLSGVSLTEPGSLTGEDFTVTLTDDRGHLAASGAGVSGAGTEALTLTGTLAQVQAELTTITDTDFYGGSDSVTLSATDSLGNQAIPATIAVNVDAAVNYPLVIPAGETAADLDLVSGGVASVYGVAIANTVGADGEVRVYQGGVTSATLVISGGRDVVSGGLAVDTVVSNGGTEDVKAGGTASHTTVDSGGVQVVIYKGTADDTLVNNGGAQVLWRESVASGTKVKDGGRQIVDGGTAENSLVGSGGSLALSGVAFTSNGKAYSYAGLASGAVIANGGREYVSAGGINSDSVISSGGMAFIYSAGIIGGASILSGATVTASSGGLVRGGLTLSGGTAIISGIVAAGQAIGFAGAGGTLGIDDPAAFSAVIGGFAAGDTIELGNFLYNSATSRSFSEAAGNTSGTLTVKNGGVSAQFTLLGDYTTNSFTLTSGTNGGTEIKIA